MIANDEQAKMVDEAQLESPNDGLDEAAGKNRRIHSQPGLGSLKSTSTREQEKPTESTRPNSLSLWIALVLRDVSISPKFEELWITLWSRDDDS